MRVGLVILLIGWAVGWWLLWRVPRLRVPCASGPAASGASVADCAVIIPARDEERNLPGLLASLARQSVRPAQVVVVDDGSTDGTAAVARTFDGVTVVEAEPLPEGWTGKSWACAQGASLSRADALVFLDADVTLGADGLGAVLGTLHDRGGLVSVQPHHRVERIDERFSALFNIVGVMGVGMASPGRDGRTGAAFGPCLATRRDDYEVVGGHGAVRAEIVEDLALARTYRSAGLPVHAFGGGREVAFRMYPDGLGQLVEGWSKNMASGAAATPVARLALTGMWVTAVLASVQFGIEHALGRGDTSWLAVGVVWALFAGQMAVMLRQLGSFGILTPVAYPAPALLFVVVFARSAWLTLVRRRVRWRGRDISVGNQPSSRQPDDEPGAAA